MFKLLYKFYVKIYWFIYNIYTSMKWTESVQKRIEKLKDNIVEIYYEN